MQCVYYMKSIVCLIEGHSIEISGSNPSYLINFYTEQHLCAEKSESTITFPSANIQSEDVK